MTVIFITSLMYGSSFSIKASRNTENPRVRGEANVRATGDQP